MPAILNLSKNAKKDEIKKAYYEAAKQHHPDKGGKKEDFQQLQAEYAAAIEAANELELNVPVKSIHSAAQPKQPNVKEETAERTIRVQRFTVTFSSQSSADQRVSALFGFLFNVPAMKINETGKLVVDNKEIGAFIYLGLFAQNIKYTQKVAVEQENAKPLLLEGGPAPLRIK